MALSGNGFRLNYDVAPVIIATSSSDNDASLPFAGYWLMTVIGADAYISDTGVRATLTSGTTNAAVLFTAVKFGPAGELVTVTSLAASGSLPLSVSVKGNAITIQLGSASTAAQVEAAVNASNAATQLVTASLPGTGASAFVAAASASLALPAATSANGAYPQGTEAFPMYRPAGNIHALAVTGTGAVIFRLLQPS